MTLRGYAAMPGFIRPGSPTGLRGRDSDSDYDTLSEDSQVGLLHQQFSFVVSVTGERRYQMLCPRFHKRVAALTPRMTSPAAQLLFIGVPYWGFQGGNAVVAQSWLLAIERYALMTVSGAGLVVVLACEFMQRSRRVITDRV